MSGVQVACHMAWRQQVGNIVSSSGDYSLPLCSASLTIPKHRERLLSLCKNCLCKLCYSTILQNRSQHQALLNVKQKLKESSSLPSCSQMKKKKQNKTKKLNVLNYKHQVKFSHCCRLQTWPSSLQTILSLLYQRHQCLGVSLLLPFEWTRDDCDLFQSKEMQQQDLTSASGGLHSSSRPFCCTKRCEELPSRNNMFLRH